MGLVLITISGPDGSGKTTHAAHAETVSRSFGRPARCVPFIGMNNAKSFACLLRGHGPEQQEASAEPAKRRGSLRRIWGSVINAAFFRVYLTLCRMQGISTVICDRYFYDSLLEVERPHSLGARLLRHAIPRPTHAFLLDAKAHDGEEQGVTERRDSSGSRGAHYESLLLSFPELEPIRFDDDHTAREQISRRLHDSFLVAA